MRTKIDRVLSLGAAVLLGGTLVASGACSREPASGVPAEAGRGKQAKAPEQAKAPAPPGPAKPTGPGVAATVNGALITEQELRDSLAGLVDSGSHGAFDPAKALDGLIEAELVEQAAEQAGYRNDPEVRKMVDAGTRRAFAEIYFQKLRAETIEKQEVTPEEIKRAGVTGETYFDVDIIVAETLEDALDVYTRHQAGKDFREIAKEVSIGSSAGQGGALGWREGSWFINMFGLDVEALNLEPGRLSNPVQTPLGYIVLRLNAVDSGKAEKQFEQIVEAIQQQKGNRRFSEITDKMMAEMPARFSESLVRSGKLKIEGLPVKTEKLPEGVYARLGSFEVDRSLLEKIGGPTILTKPYEPYLPDVIMKLLSEEHIIQVAERARQDLKGSPEMKERLRREESIAMRRKYLADTVEAKITVEPQEIIAYYSANIGQYRHGKRVELFHILVKERELANDIVRRLKAGEDFAVLARRHSTDSMGKVGGYLDIVDADRIIAPFGAEVHKLAENGVTPPVKDEAGYHIFKVGQVFPALDRGIEEAHTEVERAVKVQKAGKAAAALVAELRTRAAIAQNEPLLASLKKEYADRASSMPKAHGTGGASGARGKGFAPGTGGGRPSGHP